MARKSTEGGSFLKKMLIGKRIPGYWSVSAYEGHSECPARYALQRIINYCLNCGSTEGKEYVGGAKRCKKCKAGPRSVPAIERGIAIHAQAEQYLLGRTKGLPDDLKLFRAEFATLVRKRAAPEANWTLTADGKTCKPTDWDRAWLRVKVDAHDYDHKARHLTIIDYKTGKEKPQEHQAEVYSWVSPYYYTELKTVSVEFWWTNTGNVTNVPVRMVRGKEEPTVWTRKDLTRLESEWRKKAKIMLSDTTFAATPGPQCRYCDFRSSMIHNGGPGPCTAWKVGM